jgi:hypothetical protein
VKITSIRNLAMLGLAAALVAPLCLRAEDAPAASSDEIEELRAQLGNLSAGMNDTKSMASAIKWGINTDLRYDYQPYKPDSFAGSVAHPYIVDYLKTDTNMAGMYAKRVELEATGKIMTDVEWNLQFEFAALKLEDLGVDAKMLNLLPFVNVQGYNWEAKVGLYRQAFGLENQVGSSSTPFPERAMINGGANPWGFSKLANERAMGVQMIQTHSYGAFGYKLQIEAANNVKDQDAANGAFGGTYKVAAPLPATASYTALDSMGLKTDQDPSEMGRLGLDLNFFPSILKLNVGASALHNSNNSRLMTDDSTLQAWNDNYGYDFTLEIPVAKSTFWGEWVGQNAFTNSQQAGQPAGSAITKLVHSEGWYVVDTMKPLALFNKDWTSLDLNLRLESVMKDTDLAANTLPWLATSEQAASVGLKYYWAGKNYTSVNYTSYALNGDYTALAPYSLFVVQQQFNY